MKPERRSYDRHLDRSHRGLWHRGSGDGGTGLHLVRAGRRGRSAGGGAGGGPVGADRPVLRGEHCGAGGDPSAGAEDATQGRDAHQRRPGAGPDGPCHRDHRQYRPHRGSVRRRQDVDGPQCQRPGHSEGYAGEGTAHGGRAALRGGRSGSARPFIKQTGGRTNAYQQSVRPRYRRDRHSGDSGARDHRPQHLCGAAVPCLCGGAAGCLPLRVGRGPASEGPLH